MLFWLYIQLLKVLQGKVWSQGQSLVLAEEGANPLWGCGEDGDP